jgi:hypothetical protein
MTRMWHSPLRVERLCLFTFFLLPSFSFPIILVYHIYIYILFLTRSWCFSCVDDVGALPRRVYINYIFDICAYKAHWTLIDMDMGMEMVLLFFVS